MRALEVNAATGGWLVGAVQVTAKVVCALPPAVIVTDRGLEPLTVQFPAIPFSWTWRLPGARPL